MFRLTLVQLLLVVADVLSVHWHISAPTLSIVKQSRWPHAPLVLVGLCWPAIRSPSPPLALRQPGNGEPSDNPELSSDPDLLSRPCSYDPHQL
jgi:hypothetical protein